MTRHGAFQHLSPRLAPGFRSAPCDRRRAFARARLSQSRSQFRGRRMPIERETHVESKTKRQSQPRLYKIYRPTPAQLAAVHRVALAYREEWRKEVAASAAATSEAVSQRRSKDAAAQRAAFARAIARTEFRRHYWDER